MQMQFPLLNGIDFIFHLLFLESMKLMYNFAQFLILVLELLNFVFSGLGQCFPELLQFLLWFDTIEIFPFLVLKHHPLIGTLSLPLLFLVALVDPQKFGYRGRVEQALLYCNCFLLHFNIWKKKNLLLWNLGTWVPQQQEQHITLILNG